MTSKSKRLCLYLYRTFQSFQSDGGRWGLFRVNGGAIDTQIDELDGASAVCMNCPPR